MAKRGLTHTAIPKRADMVLVNGVSFRCHGLFHEWRDDRADFAKRALLDITRADAAPEFNPDEACGPVPDAVVAMMNPGSSTPFAGYTGPEWSERRVPTKPDAVQYQVMRLMVAAGWRHVRVVNLADVRAKKSADLYALISAGADPATLGAIFEQASIVTPEAAIGAAPVICAWGMDKRLAALARTADAWLRRRGNPLLGMPRPTAGFPAWRYPKPVGNWSLAVEWLKTLRAQAAPFSRN